MPRPEDYERVYENGKKYKELPIIYLNATKNTTKLAMFGQFKMSLERLSGFSK